MMRKTLFLIFLCNICQHSFAQNAGNPDPVKNPSSSLMLAGDWVPENSHDIDFFALPKVPSEHTIVSDVRYAWGRKTNQHNYLVHFDGRFWAMWSDGPGISRSDDPIAHRDIMPGHDQPGQLVSYATSIDGIHWTEQRDLAGPPNDGFGWIARGFWVRDGKLLALATRYRAPGYKGDGLQLHAFERVKGQEREWKHLGLVADNAMNNFAPKLLPNGKWLMSRRDKDGNVYMMTGGAEAFDQWESYPVISYQGEDFLAEEPYWFILPDKNLVAFFRDNSRSGFLYRAFSTDHGKTWTKPVKTNFPDAKSKFSGLRLSDGRYVMVSNSNPNKRDPLTIAISDDGLVFTKMGFLVGNRHVDYPHVYEYDGYLYVAFASAKQSVEVLKIRISDLDAM
ncbi:MAG: exo-alpha-sialidase [Cyclobacteriaceae bacterium]|nr:exo-alpha-sialidase [Cyclobacteriaceae bacterium]